jgi:hypothetical protein
METLQNTGDITLMPVEIRDALIDLKSNQDLLTKIADGNQRLYLEEAQDAYAAGLNPLISRLQGNPGAQPELRAAVSANTNWVEVVFALESAFLIKTYTERERIRSFNAMLDEVDALKRHSSRTKWLRVHSLTPAVHTPGPSPGHLGTGIRTPSRSGRPPPRGSALLRVSGKSVRATSSQPGLGTHAVISMVPTPTAMTPLMAAATRIPSPRSSPGSPEFACARQSSPPAITNPPTTMGPPGRALKT